MQRIVPLVVALVVVAGCVIKLPGAAPPPVGNGGGTASCREIMETCDSACQTPDCVDGCTPRGTPAAQQLHAALIACGQRNVCTSEDCMRERCGAEIDGCQADAPQAPQGPPSQQAPQPGPPLPPE